MSTIIDLHMHTNCSDGKYSPKQVLEMAKQNGVKIMAITDHDSIDAYTDETKVLAKQFGITLIQGVEISTKYGKAGIHVLGYNFDPKNELFLKTIYEARNSRHIYLYDVAKRLNELGYIVNLENLDKVDSVTKAHIATDIVENPKNAEKLMSEFGHIPSMGEFIEAIMNEGCIGYVAKKSISPIEASKIIKQAGGKCVLAHPVAYKYEDNLSENDILELIDKMQPDGIEANYIYVDNFDNAIDECDFWLNVAKTKSLFATIGSDFHREKPNSPLIGFKNGDKIFDVDAHEILENLTK